MAHLPDDGDVIVEEGSAPAWRQGEAGACGFGRQIPSSREAT
jgi:hypothetical protein